MTGMMTLCIAENRGRGRRDRRYQQIARRQPRSISLHHVSDHLTCQPSSDISSTGPTHTIEHSIEPESWLEQQDVLIGGSYLADVAVSGTT